MAVGLPHRRPRFRMADLDPHSRDLREGTQGVRERDIRWDHFAAGGEGAGELQSWVYLRPLGRDRHLVEGPAELGTTGVEMPSATGEDAYVPGQRVIVGLGRSGGTILGRPPGGDLALSERPAEKREAVATPVRVTAMDPADLESGSVNVAVSLMGYGFSQTPLDDFQAVQYDETADPPADIPDPNITISAVVWVSAEEVTATITVAPGTPIGQPIDIEVTRA